MSERVLLVDDEQSILDGYRRNLRKQFAIDTAVRPADALEMIDTAGPFAVVVSDLQMPEMNGIEFLARVRAIAPDTDRMMHTGQADLDVSIAAVNTGNVFRFLTKPCDPERLGSALTAGLDQYRLVRAERELLENTLHGAVRMLTEVLSMLDPGSQALAGHVQATVERLGRDLGISSWEIELAAMLSQLGNLTLPNETATKLCNGGELTAEERIMADRAPSAGSRLLAHVPRLERVAQIIADQDVPPPTAATAEPDSDLVAIGANLLHVAVRFERLLAAGLHRDEACEQLRRVAVDEFQLSLVAHLAGDLAQPEWREDVLPLNAVTTDMVLTQDVFATSGVLLLGKDAVVSQARLERLRTFAAGVGIDEPVHVLVQVPTAEPAVSFS